MIKALFGKLKTWAIGAAIFAGAVALAFWQGMKHGRSGAAADRAREREDARRKRAEVDEDIAGLDGTHVDERLAKWMRDNPNR